MKLFKGKGMKALSVSLIAAGSYRPSRSCADSSFHKITRKYGAESMTQPHIFVFPSELEQYRVTRAKRQSRDRVTRLNVRRDRTPERLRRERTRFILEIRNKEEALAVSPRNTDRLQPVEVALESGFSDVKYFSTFFHKEMKLSPSAYRRAYEADA